MRVILRSERARLRRDVPQLLTPWSRRFDWAGNLAAAFDRRQPLPFRFRDIFPQVFPDPWQPQRPLCLSVLAHVLAVIALANLPLLLLFTTRPPQAKPLAADRRLTWYNLADQLPAIRSGDEEKPPQEQGGRRRGPAPKGSSVLRPQLTVSNPPDPDNDRQTIVQPDGPQIKIPHEVRLPNVVAWREVERPLPPVDLVTRPIAKLQMPAELIRRHVDLPEELPNMERRLGELKMASSAALHPSPALPVVPATSAAGNAPPGFEPVAPPAESVLGGSGNPSAQLHRLIAISAHPAPPNGPLDVPPGNRSGAFSAGPEGRMGTPFGSIAGLEGAGGVGPAVAGEGGGSGARQVAGIRVPGLSVIGPAVAPPGVPIVARSAPAGEATAPPSLPPAPPPAPRPALPSPLRPEVDPSTLTRGTRPSYPDWKSGRPTELGFSAGKKIYTVYINMPNLSSGSGSWVLKFAELEDRTPAEVVDIAAPVAIRKIDPGYVPEAIREKIEGQVLLRAIIRKDGHVERIEILRGLDPRLDQRAIAALARWEFQPATRNGTPVDLEAVIQIPFRLPLRSF